jgi:hypothetical protein
MKFKFDQIIFDAEVCIPSVIEDNGDGRDDLILNGAGTAFTDALKALPEGRRVFCLMVAFTEETE